MKNHREDLKAQMGRPRKSVSETFIPDDAADEKMVSLLIRMPETHRKELKRRSVELEVSMSEIVRELVSEYLDKPLSR